MKVLLGHNYYRSSAPSGEDAVFDNERGLLLSKGIEIIPFTKHNDDIDESSLGNRISLALSSAWSKQTYAEISLLIKNTKPDIAHFHNTFPQISPSAYAACQDLDVPVIQTLHNYRFICPGALLQRNGKPCEDCVGSTLLPALIHRCYRDSVSATAAQVWSLTYNRLRNSYAKLVDRYIALTEFAGSRLQAGGLPGDRFSIKPNFLPNPPPPGNGGGGYAVYVGRLSSEKGVETLLRAWRNLPNIPLKVLGDGPLRQQLEASAKAHNLPIEFLGYRGRQEILDIVRDAVMQIVPSEWYEGFPMVILEAYACGTPVIASRIGSLDEIIIEGMTGEKFSPRDAEGLSNCVNDILNSGKLGLMRKQVRERFDSLYTGEQNFLQLKTIYDSVLSDIKAG